MTELFPGMGLTCARVWDQNFPVLYVSHEDDCWQLLCGGDEHEDSAVIRVVHGHHLLERDATIAQVADLPIGMRAERDSPTAPWTRSEIEPEPEEDIRHVHASEEERGDDGFTPSERRCIDNIARYGLHILQIAPGEEDDGFSYTVGLFAKYGHPEIIVFGQKTKWQGDMLNFLAAEIAAGKVFSEGRTYRDIIEGFECRFSLLRDIDDYRSHVGWDIWYYRDVLRSEMPPPVLQFVWPYRSGNFPDSAEYKSYRQPLLK